jgi:hypothetical protein
LLVLAAWRPTAIVTMTDRIVRPFPTRVHDLATRFAMNFARALSVLRGGSRLAKVVALSLVAWCCELSLFLVLLPALHITPSMPMVPLAFLAGSASNFATLVPSSPGYVGTFDGALSKVLHDTANIDLGQATAYAFVVHATLIVPVVILGLLILWRSHMTFTQITHAPEVNTTSSSEKKDLVAA